MEDKPKRNIHLFNTEIDYWLSHDEIESVIVRDKKREQELKLKQELKHEHNHSVIFFANGEYAELPFRIGKIKQIIEESGNKEYFVSERSKISHKKDSDNKQSEPY